MPTPHTFTPSYLKLRISVISALVYFEYFITVGFMVLPSHTNIHISPHSLDFISLTTDLGDSSVTAVRTGNILLPVEGHNHITLHNVLKSPCASSLSAVLREILTLTILIVGSPLLELLLLTFICFHTKTSTLWSFLPLLLQTPTLSIHRPLLRLGIAA